MHIYICVCVSVYIYIYTHILYTERERERENMPKVLRLRTPSYNSLIKLETKTSLDKVPTDV